MFEDLRQYLEDTFRITKGVGKIWSRVQVHGKNVIVTFIGGSKEYQISLSEYNIRTKISYLMEDFSSKWYYIRTTDRKKPSILNCPSFFKDIRIIKS
jgi:hypothetical protein